MKRKKIFTVAVIAALLAAVYAGGKIFIYHKIDQKIRAQADTLRSKGFTVNFDSLETNPWSNTISVRNVLLIFPGNSCNDTASRAAVRQLTVSGISLASFVLHKEIKVARIAMDKPYYLSSGYSVPGQKKNNAPSQIRSVAISALEIKQGSFETMDSGYCRIKQRGTFSLDVGDIRVDNPGAGQKISVGDARLFDTQIELPMKYYSIKLHQLSYRAKARHATVDSLNLLPWYDNITFVRKTGVQTDRVDLRIPRIEIAGLDPVLSGSGTFHVSRAELSFKADVFRDKRQPRGKQTEKKLISGMIHDISFPLQIDSVIVGPSSVSYEEFQPTGNKSGTVTFESLSASIGNISTVSKEPMTMKARARFMNAGDLNAFFTFPANPEKPYTIKGMLTGFDLPKLNRILIPAANAEIKKGHLKAMMFNFEYNDYRSDGQLTMNYSDLDIVSLLKNKNQKEENKFLTLILKSFIVKKDMDRSKSTGTILFYRDRDKASFNFWWKSILSGVKSLYNLDKVIDTHHSKKK